MKKLQLLGAVCAFLLSTPLHAVFVLDFGSGLAGSGGTINDVNSDGSVIVGENINIGSFEAVNTSADGVYVTDALLNFNTALNTIKIDGTISDLGINSSITLLSGSFQSWNYDPSGSIVNFNGGGVDTKHDDLLDALGIPLDTQFEFFAFTLGFDTTADSATAISTDIINTSVVPVPAAVWLFGSGLLGLIGMARRKKAA